MDKYTLHHLYSASGLMLMDKVTSSIHVDYIKVPSILCTQRRSWYIEIFLWGLLEKEHKGKENDAPSPEPQSKTTEGWRN